MHWATRTVASIVSTINVNLFFRLHEMQEAIRAWHR